METLQFITSLVDNSSHHWLTISPLSIHVQVHFSKNLYLFPRIVREKPASKGGGLVFFQRPVGGACIFQSPAEHYLRPPPDVNNVYSLKMDMGTAIANMLQGLVSFRTHF